MCCGTVIHLTHCEMFRVRDNKVKAPEFRMCSSLEGMA
jgi:hypothetical protein